ncbi:MAG: transcription-repair coupling factor [Bacteroidaceae bacterium]|nr:transcription-repair coupling factor [Bacteroidaceae bacterium]
MEMTELGRLYARHPARRALLQKIDGKTSGMVFLDGLRASSASLFFSTLIGKDDFRRSVLFILNDREQAAYFYHDLKQILGEQAVMFFPSSYRRAIRFGQKDNAGEILRTEVLSALSSNADGRQYAVVTSPDALAEMVVSERKLNEYSICIRKGEEYDRDELQDRLFDMGFEHVDYVYEPGQYALRGSILDIYSFSSDEPCRIDFFGDEVDSIRHFQVDSQLSTDVIDSVLVVPELTPSADGDCVSLLDFLPSDSIVAAVNPELAAELMDNILKEIGDTGSVSSRMRIIDASKDKTDHAEDASLPQLMDGGSFKEKVSAFLRVEFGARPTAKADWTVRFNVSPQQLFHKNFDMVTESLGACLAKGYHIYILSDSVKQTERLEAIFTDRGDHIPFIAVNKTLHEGFVDDTLHICCYTDHQIFDRYHKFSLTSDKVRSGKVALTLKELSEFEIGDYVVHMDYGIGQFGGLVKENVNGVMQEKVKIIYRNNDVALVSIHALHKLSKYKGREGEPPRVSTLGTGAWENMKERTKGKIKDIARDLIKLYAKRLEEKGFAFSPDSFMQTELEAGFMYEDTPDQLKTTIDIKADMESARPMDRLVCGDVGFGKTEVAVRAAFKAVADSKQVAVLVPTTILAFQHFKTFSERLRNFPCKVEYLSRARSQKQITEILEKLADGKIDIIVGTHKLIGKNVRFKDLGLLIIDEEQKFGVSVKEKLKAIKVNVDTLTLTATPIPRTLQFSLMGARDLSIIQTPPPNRYPIQTEVHVFSADLIREAVNFEMSRNGQVFLVNNHISGLHELKELVEREVPDARVCIGHGQMNPDELENVLLSFINYDYDVLIATSIVENGIDIPNVNTIIINHAHNFGLSDLHQMRGRVGRGNRKAFCYLLAPPLGALPSTTRRRLEAIENFSDLGSGIQLAMQDLDIRGAGNLLGAEQSGFIADLGYETYQKILKEAVRELKADEFADLFSNAGAARDRNAQDEVSASLFVDECTVETDMQLLFPATFVPNGSERIALYRELDAFENENEIAGFRSRLEDRFGRIPEEAEELIRLVSLRRRAKDLGIERIFLKGGKMSLFFVSDPDSAYYDSAVFSGIITYAMAHPDICRLREKEGRNSIIVDGVGNVSAGVKVLEQMKLS